MNKVWNKRDPNVPKDAVYVGRPTKWGNPFKLGSNETRHEVVEKHSKWIQQHPLRHDLHELRGKDLVCWCAPLDCHADTLLRLANQEGSNAKRD